MDKKQVFDIVDQILSQHGAMVLGQLNAKFVQIAREKLKTVAKRFGTTVPVLLASDQRFIVQPSGKTDYRVSLRPVSLQAVHSSSSFPLGEEKASDVESDGEGSEGDEIGDSSSAPASAAASQPSLKQGILDTLYSFLPQSASVLLAQLGAQYQQATGRVLRKATKQVGLSVQALFAEDSRFHVFEQGGALRVQRRIGGSVPSHPVLTPARTEEKKEPETESDAEETVEDDGDGSPAPPASNPVTVSIETAPAPSQPSASTLPQLVAAVESLLITHGPMTLEALSGRFKSLSSGALALGFSKVDELLATHPRFRVDRRGPGDCTISLKPAVAPVLPSVRPASPSAMAASLSQTVEFKTSASPAAPPAIVFGWQEAVSKTRATEVSSSPQSTMGFGGTPVLSALAPSSSVAPLLTAVPTSGKTQLLNVIVTVVSQLGSTTLAELYGHYIRATGGKLGKAATSLGYGKSTGVVQLLQSDPRLSVVKTPNTKGHKSWKISLRSGLAPEPPATEAQRIHSLTPPVSRSVTTSSAPPKWSVTGPVLVDSADKLDHLAAMLQSATVIGCDSEGINLSRDGKLTLIQLAVPSGATAFVKDTPAVSPCQVFIVDVLLNNTALRDGALKVVRACMESPKVIKVFHDCRQDSAALFHQLDIRLVNVFDTSVAHIVRHRQLQTTSQTSNTVAVATGGKVHVGMNELLQRYSLASNTHKRAMAYKLKEDETVWSKRPLTAEMIQYAAQDVASLIALALRMRSDIASALSTPFADALELILHLSELHLQVFRNADKSTDVVIPNLGHFQAGLPAELDAQMLLDMGFAVSCTFADDGSLIWEQRLAQRYLAAAPLASLPPEDGLPRLLALFPSPLRSAVEGHQRLSELLDIQLDQHREITLHFLDDTWEVLAAPLDQGSKPQAKSVPLVASAEIIASICRHLRFGDDNRAAIEGSLHRISAIYSKDKKRIIGLSCRVGRSLQGMANFLKDCVVQNKSVLILGPPGAGKTTIIRDMARAIADRKRVMVVDTSCEIGGDGDVPHPCLGRARRMQVSHLSEQKHVMVEAVKNHTPQVLVIDEITNKGEAQAARTIANRGVTLIASAHGNLESLVKNHELNDLIGGVTGVILGDRSAQQTQSGEKVQERRWHVPVFDVVVEFLGKNKTDAKDEKSKDTDRKEQTAHKEREEKETKIEPKEDAKRPKDTSTKDSGWAEWAINASVADTVDRILKKMPYCRQIRAFHPRTGALHVHNVWVKP